MEDKRERYIERLASECEYLKKCLKKCVSHWKGKYSKYKQLAETEKLESLNKEIEIANLKKDRDEWEETARYWESQYDEEHREFLEDITWENSPAEVNKLRDKLRELNRRLDHINCK